MLAEAIAHYHSLLDLDTARATKQQLDKDLRAEHLFFGDRPLVTVLRPRLMTDAQYTMLQQGCNLVAEAARKAVAPGLEPGKLGDAVRSRLMLTPGEQALIEIHPGYEEMSCHSRMDTFLTVDGESLQFVEYNAESPAAIAYEDIISEVFLELPVMQQFAQRYNIRTLPARHRIRDALLNSWREAGAPGDEPCVAIVDWSDLPTSTEFLLFKQYFQQHNIPAFVCTPDDMLLRDGKLHVRSKDGSETRITIVYKRILTSEFMNHYGDEALQHPMIQAYANATCVIVNSFRCKLLHKKSIFALLTNELFQGEFSTEELAAIERHVPWTRVVLDGEATYQGEHVDLVDFTRSNRDRLLLKPNDDYGGNGITVGWESSADEWDVAIKRALSEPFVVQERVKIAYEDYPSLIDGKVDISQRLVDSDPFLFGSEVEGALCRLATVTLLNVTSGGGSTVPVFVVDEKS